MRFYFFPIILLSLVFFLSCQYTDTPPVLHVKKTCVIKHENFYDSIEYKIVETKYKNDWKRDLIVFINDSANSKINILDDKLRSIHIDGDYTEKKKTYTIENPKTIIVTEKTTNYTEFIQTSSNSISYKLIIEPTGDVSKTELPDVSYS